MVREFSGFESFRYAHGMEPWEGGGVWVCESVFVIYFCVMVLVFWIWCENLRISGFPGVHRGEPK